MNLLDPFTGPFANIIVILFLSNLVVAGRARSRPSLHLSAGCIFVFQRIPCITNLSRSPCYLENRQQTGVGALSSIADVTNLSNRYPPERDFGYVVLYYCMEIAMLCVALRSLVSRTVQDFFRRWLQHNSQLCCCNIFVLLQEVESCWTTGRVSAVQRPECNRYFLLFFLSLSKIIQTNLTSYLLVVVL